MAQLSIALDFARKCTKTTTDGHLHSFDGLFTARLTVVAGTGHTCQTRNFLDTYKRIHLKPDWWMQFRSNIQSLQSQVPRHEFRFKISRIIVDTRVDCKVCLETAVYDMWAAGKAVMNDIDDIMLNTVGQIVHFRI